MCQVQFDQRDSFFRMTVISITAVAGEPRKHGFKRPAELIRAPSASERVFAEQAPPPKNPIDRAWALIGLGKAAALAPWPTPRSHYRSF